jgi:hypothetical protein
MSSICAIDANLTSGGAFQNQSRKFDSSFALAAALPTFWSSQAGLRLCLGSMRRFTARI